MLITLNSSHKLINKREDHKTSLDGSSTARGVENGSKRGREGEQKRTVDGYATGVILCIHLLRGNTKAEDHD